MASKVAPGGLPSGLDPQRIVAPELVRGARRPPARRAGESGVEASEAAPAAVDERLRALAARVDAGQRALDAAERELGRQLGALDALAASLARQAGVLGAARDEGA